MGRAQPLSPGPRLPPTPTFAGQAAECATRGRSRSRHLGQERVLPALALCPTCYGFCPYPASPHPSPKHLSLISISQPTVYPVLW